MAEAYCSECLNVEELEIIEQGELRFYSCSNCGKMPLDEKEEVFTEDQLDRLIAYSKEWAKDRSAPHCQDAEIIRKLLEKREDIQELQDERDEPFEQDCICNSFIAVIDALDALILTVKGKIEERIEEFKEYLQEDDMEKCVREGYELALQKLEASIEDIQVPTP